jgi:hypothetical protein
MTAELEHEINLMPREVEESRLRRLYLARISRMLKRLYPLLFLLLVAEIFIYFSLISVRDDVILFEASGLQGSRDMVKNIEQINDLLLQVEKRSSTYTSSTPQVQEILSVMPGGVKLGLIGIAEKDGSLIIEGDYSIRSSVVEFQKELRVLPWVESVESPLQNFALKPGAVFSFNVFRKEIKKQ